MLTVGHIFVSHYPEESACCRISSVEFSIPAWQHIFRLTYFYTPAVVHCESDFFHVGSDLLEVFICYILRMEVVVNTIVVRSKNIRSFENVIRTKFRYFNAFHDRTLIGIDHCYRISPR